MIQQQIPFGIYLCVSKYKSMEEPAHMCRNNLTYNYKILEAMKMPFRT